MSRDGASAGSKVRQFSQLRLFTSSATCHGKLTPLPVRVFGIAGRYASALYSAASKQDKLAAVEKDINDFKGLLQKDRKLADFVFNPSLKRLEKRSVLEQALRRVKYTDLTVNLIGILAESGRISHVEGVMSSFGQLMSAKRGEIPCAVKTAKVLDSAMLSELGTVLQGFLKKGQSVQLTTEVDPSLIGGMVVSIGDRYVDMSMATRIKNYTNLIKQPV